MSTSEVIQPSAVPDPRKNERLIFVDVLNIVSSFAVVLLHTSLNVFTPERSPHWAISLFAQSLAIFAVPVFFMVSGMNLLGYRARYSTKTFIRKRLLRVGVSLFLASIFAYVLFCMFPSCFYGAEKFGGSFSAKDFLKGFLTNQILDIYWFLYAIIYLYVLTPLLSVVARSKKLLEYTLALCFGVSVCIPLAEHLGANPIYFQTLFGWALFANVNLFYFLLGCYLSTYAKPAKRLWGYVLAYGLSAAIMFGGSLMAHGYFGSGQMGAYDGYLVGITSPCGVVLSISVFQLAKSLEPWLRARSTRIRLVISAMSRCAFGIYLFHILFINWTGGGPLGHLLGSLSDPFAKTLLVYALTLGVVALFRKLLQLGRGAFSKTGQ